MPAVLEPLKLQRQVVRRIGAAVTQHVVMAQYTAFGGCTGDCGGTGECNSLNCNTNNYTICKCETIGCPVETDACGTGDCATNGCPPQDTVNGCIIIPDTNFCTIPTTQCFPETWYCP